MEKLIRTVFVISLLTVLLSVRSVMAQTTNTPIPTDSIAVSATPLSETPSITPTPTATPEPTQQIAILTHSAVGTQSPWNKQIPVTLIIKPLIDGQRITITWQKRTGIEAAPQYAVINNPKANQTYTLSFSLTPQAVGYQRTVAEVVLVTNTSNYVTSQDVVVNLDQNKVVTPTTAGYQASLIFMYVSIFVFFIIVVPLTLFYGGKYFQKKILPKWYAKQIQAPQN